MTPQKTAIREVKAHDAASERKCQRKKTRKQCLEAVLIKPAEGKSYAEVLGGIKSKLKLGETKTCIRSIRLTTNGAVLLELGKETDDVKAVKKCLQKYLRDIGTIRNLVHTFKLQILDLDSITTREDIEDAPQRDLGAEVEGAKVSIMKANRRGQVIAIVEISKQVADKHLETACIKVLWISGRVG